jgi:RHS repeat-associated protein
LANTTDNRRVAKFIDGALVERYGHDGTNLAVVLDAAGQVSNRYLYGSSIDEVLADQTPTTLNWALANRLGTVDLIVDDKGGVIDRVTFDSFGNKVSESAPEKSFRFGFTGRELDPETGLYYYRAQYYDPLVGRFISVDSIGFQAGDTNLYRYVFNSPTQGIDPTGHEFDLGQSWNNFWGGVQSAAEGISDGTRYAIDSVYNGIGNTAQESLEYYAQLAVNGEKEGGVFGFGKQVIGTAGGVLSALATKENLWKTGAVLTAGVFAAPALAVAGSTTGVIGFGVQTFTTGALAVGAFDVVKQDLKIIEGSQKEFKWDEFAIASASGGVFALLAATSPILSAGIFTYGTITGVQNGVKEWNAGHKLSGGFEIATSLIPLLGAKKFAGEIRSLPKGFREAHGVWQGKAAKAANDAFNKDLWDLFPSGQNGAKSEPESGGFIRELSDEEAGAIWGRGTDENHLSDPWIGTPDVPLQGRATHGNLEHQPSTTLVPEGFVQHSDGSIIATPSRMLAPSNRFVSLEPDTVFVPEGISIRTDLPGHLKTFDGINQGAGKINGTHNMNTFDKVVINNGIKAAAPLSTGTDGIFIVEYQVQRLNSARTPDGTYKNPQIKTVYDPSIISDTEIVRLGQIAAMKGYEANVALGKTQYSESAGGIKFRIYLNKNNKLEITNIHPE